MVDREGIEPSSLGVDFQVHHGAIVANYGLRHSDTMPLTPSWAMHHRLCAVLEKNMNIYAVIMLAEDADANKTAETLRSLDPSVYEHYASRGVYFVRFNCTAQQLSEKLGLAPVSIATEHSAKTGIVIGVNQYFGFANNDLWNWLAPS